MADAPDTAPDAVDAVRLSPWPAAVFADFDPAWIVYRDDALIAVDKPAGMPCQAADPEQPDDLVTRLRRHLAAERGVPEAQVYLGVHQRLDQDTSGVVLYTLQREVNAAVAAQFESRSVGKHYVAVVAPYAGPEQATLRDRLSRGRDGRMQVVAADGSGGKRGGGKRGGRKRAPAGDAKLAITDVRRLSQRGQRALLELAPRTGRTHQLRVQLSHAGAPIVGDRLYGDEAAPRLWLHAAGLTLKHPVTGAELQLRAPEPAGLQDALAAPGTLTPAAFDIALGRALQARFGLARERTAPAPTTAFRLLHGAADGVPGLAVDVYDRFLVLHVMSAEAEALEPQLLDRLHAVGLDGVYLKRHPRQKNELGAEAQEALCPAEPMRGSAAPEQLVVYEHGVPFGVRLGDGLRTGIFLDMRDNRRRMAELCRGKRMLNLFTYTGGFSVAALHAGASEALCVDTSKAALERARDNAARLGAGDRHATMAEDAFDALARFARKGRVFDVIILDPPSYSTSRKRRFRVTRDYPELCARCLRVLAPGGTLLACINHHGVSQAQLRAMVHAAAEQAGLDDVRIRDVAPQRDFPAEPGKQPLAKQLMVSR